MIFRHYTFFVFLPAISRQFHFAKTLRLAEPLTPGPLYGGGGGGNRFNNGRQRNGNYFGNRFSNGGRNNGNRFNGGRDTRVCRNCSKIGHMNGFVALLV